MLLESFPLVDPRPAEPEAWVRTALFQNHRLESLKEESEVARHEIKVQKGARLPSLNFIARYRGTDSGGSVFLGAGGSTVFNTDVGLQVSIPIWDGGLWSARARAALR